MTPDEGLDAEGGFGARLAVAVRKVPPLHRVRRVCQPRRTEVGACTPSAERIFALDLGAEVIAVEPTSNAERVHEHLRLNGYKAVMLREALGNRPGTVRITEDLDSYNHLVWESDVGTEVEATTLDEVLNDRVAAGVKIDAEGVERLVLEGAQRSLAEQRIRFSRSSGQPTRAQEMLGGRSWPGCGPPAGTWLRAVLARQGGATAPTRHGHGAHTGRVRGCADLRLPTA